MAKLLKFESVRDAAKKPAFDQVYEENYDRVYKYTYSILLNREDTEDVVSNTFMAAYAAYDRYDPEKSSPATWLMRIAHNEAINLVRSAAYSKRTEMPEYYEVPDNSEDSVRGLEDKEAVLFLYSKLSISEREFLNMRYAMQMKDAEVAETMGLPVKTVNKRYQRLLVKCREILENR
ncbi:MAG: sigma-70 family RNA polymerase sigma factor [Mogibacterium sp.]|nr:sigma-70 family RNA polymerase sigma factor [Mogibacterium sp.]